jgi:chitinase
VAKLYIQKKENTKAVSKKFLVFRPHQLLLTAAIGAATPTIDVAYDIPRMYKYLDYIHVMCYDYHGKWDRKTGHNAPLYPRPNEKGQDVLLNVDNTLEYLMKKGALPEKTVLGVPLYGRAFSLMNPHDYKMGARAKTTSFQVHTPIHNISVTHRPSHLL